MDTQVHIGGTGELSSQRTDQAEIFSGRFKPYDAFWTSTLVAGSSAWADWCREEAYQDVDAMYWHQLTPSPAARIYVIDTLADLAALVEAYPSTVCGYTYPDWAAVSRDYDGVHLTGSGQVATRFSRPYNLYGWDCESTAWFRWVFTDAKLMDRSITKPEVRMRTESDVNEAISLIVTRLSAINNIEYEYDTKGKDKRSAEWRALTTERIILRGQLAGLCWARGDNARLGVIGHPLNDGDSIGEWKQ